MTSVHVVPHTHWDREWYRSFQGFRMRLVDVVDRVLETLDADPELRFTLDGQVAIVDDYLEIRTVQPRRGTGYHRARALPRCGRAEAESVIGRCRMCATPTQTHGG